MSSPGDDHLPVRVLLRPIGTPLPLGLAGLAIAALVASGLDLGWVPARETAQVGLVLLAVPTVLQLLASIFSYLSRDGAAGTGFGVLASSWLAQGLIHVASPRGLSATLGLLLLIVAGVLWLTAITLVQAKLVPALAVTLAATHFAL